MPSPSALYEFALANPSMDFDIIDAMLPEGQRVSVTNRGIPAQETWQCRLGFAVPQQGCAQWMHDREPCHTSGFQKYEYIRHFYQFHLGLGRPSGVGNTRVDQLSKCRILTLHPDVKHANGLQRPLLRGVQTLAQTRGSAQRRRWMRAMSQDHLAKGGAVTIRSFGSCANVPFFHFSHFLT
jgi:hypothetical protein